MDQAREYERHTFEPDWEMHLFSNRLDWPHEFGVLLGSNEAAAKFPPTHNIKEESKDISRMKDHLDHLIMKISQRIRIPHRFARMVRSLDLIVVFPFHPMPDDILRGEQVVHQRFDSIQEFVRFRAVSVEEKECTRRTLWKSMEVQVPKDLQQQQLPSPLPFNYPPTGFEYVASGQYRQLCFYSEPNQQIQITQLGVPLLQSATLWSHTPPLVHQMSIQHSVVWPLYHFLSFGQIGGLVMNEMVPILHPLPHPHFRLHVQVVEQWPDGRSQKLLCC